MEFSGTEKEAALFFKIMLFIIICMVCFGMFEAEASEFGLIAEFSNVLAPTDNLNPGDVKSSVMTLKLEEVDGYDISSLPAYIRSEIISRDPGPGGGDLDEVLVLTVRKESGDVVYEGHLSGFDENIYLGEVYMDEGMDLEFTIYLPGEETTNEYQGSGLRVKWIITTQYSESRDDGSDDPDDSDDSDDSNHKDDDKKDEGSVDDMDESGNESEEDEGEDKSDSQHASRGESVERVFDNSGDVREEVIEIEESIPAGLPRTGTFPKGILYSLGAVAVIGIIIKALKNNRTFG
ncbi:hypothetical protein SAMN02745751_00314 [Dethiosulfatibacter aminovorans DSM 17477]|uniref:LPXTG-motif cell wall anchor domain-containing protein n=1 Tax=Dethiosulfatibacter aminovorans DSM 17477 TaxID=1121476 RepID=A0A1M6B0H8_9FIRM|nr:hypothetical protein [Dethiosulfatibacter aminovorans]SHI42264.1 hypothetical protein SAMN02745751_00314 [Dethiosulfatibacter aminovorans DSM 17477]